MKDEKLVHDQISDNGKDDKRKYPVKDDIPTKNKKQKITSASQPLPTRQFEFSCTSTYSTLFHESVKLPNPGRLNFCWLNSISYMLISSGLNIAIKAAIDERPDILLRQVKLYFDMLCSAQYSPSVHSDFAMVCLEKMRDSKYLRKAKEQYILGESQDVHEAMQASVYCFLDFAEVLYTNDVYIHPNDNPRELQRKFSFVCQAAGPVDFIFVTPSRTAITRNNKVFVDSCEITAIEDVLMVNTDLNSTTKIICTFRLMNFVAYYGAIEAGHYITYVHDYETPSIPSSTVFQECSSSCT